MPILIPFTKLHGLANDFVLIEVRKDEDAPALTKPIIKAIADRKRGVGFDQLLVLRESSRVHASLEIFNADGSIAEMCGNGLRAAALYLWTRGGIKDKLLVIETSAGDRRARALGPFDAADLVIECEMGVPKLLPTPKALSRGVRLKDKTQHPICVNVGNPHAVVFTTPKNAQELSAWGRMIENHKAFPKRTNVEFVRVRDAHVIDVQVWERGVGITEACGTGAVASACAAIAQGFAKSPVEVRFPGGQAEVVWDGSDAKTRSKTPALLRGQAREVFQGVFQYSEQ